MNATFWFILKPCSEIKNKWTVHCPEIDAVSIGDSMMHALGMGIDASILILESDNKIKANSLLRRAPDEFWKELYHLIDFGENKEFSDIDQTEAKIVGVIRDLKGNGPKTAYVLYNYK